MLAPVAAVSVGIVDGEPMLDLCYEEDSVADVDMNVVMNAEGLLIELQATAEGQPFSRTVMGQLLDSRPRASSGCSRCRRARDERPGAPPRWRSPERAMHARCSIIS